MTKWIDSLAREARWGEEIGKVLGLTDETPLLYDDAELDYQGHGSFIAQVADDKFVLYGWSYGSCSGCDSWEGEEHRLADDVRNAAQRTDRATLIAYLRRIAEHGRKGEDPAFSYYAPSSKSAAEVLVALEAA